MRFTPRLPTLSPAVWMTTQNLFAQGFGLLLFAIQAPLLGPKAFGLITLVMIFVGFCEFVLEVASTDALISIRAIDDRHYATMTTANAAFSITLGLVLVVTAPLIAQLFGEPDLVPIMRCMAVMPLVSALATAPNAYSRRAMQFKPLALRVLVSVLLSGTLGLILTLRGFGVWALVWQAVTQRLLNVGVLWRLVPIRFQLGFSRPHFVELWRYAGPMLLSQFMAWSSSQIPRFILGLFLGAAELGLFSLATRIHEILLVLTLSPNFAVARVTMREHAPHSAGLNDAVARLLGRMGMLCFPVAVGGAAVMPVLFVVWLDARWAGGVHVAQFMLLGAMPFATHYALSAALLGLNKQASVAINSTVQTVSVVIVTALFAPWGLNAATAAIAFRPLATSPIPLYFARKQCGIPIRLVLRAQLPLFVAALLMGAVVWLIELLLAPVLTPAALLAVAIASGMALYPLFCLWLAPRTLTAPFSERLRRALGR